MDLKKIIDGISDFLHNEVDYFKLGADFTPWLYIALAGSALVIVAFLIALIAKSQSKIKKATKNINLTTQFVKNEVVIDESNISALNQQMLPLPNSVNEGFGKFLGEQVAYPSEYMPEKDLVDDPTANPRHSGGKGAFKALSWIFIAICAIVTAIAANSLWALKTLEITQLLVLVLSIGAAPFIVFVILLTIINAGYRSQIKKMAAAYKQLRHALDDSVALFRHEEDVFISQNVEEINAAIEEILANRIERKMVVDVVSIPEPTPEPVVEETAADYAPEVFLPEEDEEVEPDIFEIDEPVFVPAATEEEREHQLIQLVFAIDALVSDPRTTQSDIETCAMLLISAQNSGYFNDPEIQEIFTDCFTILSAAFYS